MREQITAENLKDIPVRGLIALVARCGDRIFPLTRMPHSDSPKECSATLEIARRLCIGEVNRDELLPILREGVRDVFTLPSPSQSDGVSYDRILHESRASFSLIAGMMASSLDYLSQVRNAWVAADNLADTSHDPELAMHDDGTREEAIERAGNLAANEQSEADAIWEDLVKRTVRLIERCSELVFEAASPELHSDLMITAEADRNAIQSAVLHDIEQLRTVSHHGHPAEFCIELSELGELWSDGIPDWWTETESNSEESSPTETSPPAIAIVWDPELISEEEYAELVVALGDFVRAEGAVGVERLKSQGFGVPCESGVTL